MDRSARTRPTRPRRRGPAPAWRPTLATGPAKVLRQAYAWVDPDGNPDSKGSYKFIHHEVGPRCEVRAANVKACTSGTGILNGARGGANVPPATEKASTTTWRDIFVTQERSRQVSSEVRLVKIYVGHRPNKQATRVMALFVMA